MPFVCDLDGVIWLGDRPIVGSADAVACLREETGERVVFVTNNSSVTIAEQEAKLARMGIPAEGDVINSAMALGTLIEPAERVYVVGGQGVRDALSACGAVLVETGPADTVVVGMDRQFTYEALDRASGLVREGSRFLATNTDATYPGTHGLEPGAGSLVAAIERAGGRGPDAVAGKPELPMVRYISDLLGPVGTVIGDRDDTDGEFARALGYRFALVLTGVTTRADLPLDHPPDVMAPDLSALIALLGHRGGSR